MRRHLAIIAFLVTGCTLWANGDPVATFCALTLSRNPIGVHVPEVQLKDEHLTVTPVGRYTLVRVEYLLYNNSKKDFVNLSYGFPIDYYRHGSDRWASEDGISEYVTEAGWRDDYVTEVVFTLNGIQLPFQISADSLLKAGRLLLTPAEVAKDKKGDLFETRLDSINYALYEYESDLLRRWYYTRLNIPAGKAVKLVVQYRVENSCTVSLSEQDALVSQPRGHCNFAYDFSPASYWGNGKAETFDAWVDVSRVRTGRNLEDTSSCVPQGLPMHKTKGDRWHYTTRNFDLAKAAPLRFYYWFENESARLTDLFNHRIAPTRYTVEVSGSDPKYPATNLSDMDLATATVLRPGKGDSLYITVRFKQPTKVKTILFYNGYCKDAATWRNNSRVASMMVYNPSGDHYDPFFYEYYKALPEKMVPHYNKGPKPLRTTMPDNFTWQGLTDAAEIMHISDYYSNPPLTEICFSIATTTRGAKYDDLCISEIILLE
jgi:hypothetical protein